VKISGRMREKGRGREKGRYAFYNLKEGKERGIYLEP